MTAADLTTLSGQTSIVTGSSSGIGRATALELARSGANAVINYFGSPDDADEAVREIGAFGGNAIAVRADVSREAEVAELFDAAEAAFGAVDIVVSNAGIQRDAPLGDMSLKAWNDVIAVNLTGAFLVGREAVRRFRSKGPRPDVSAALGKLVYTSSVHQIIPWAFHVNYAASKGGIHMLMQSIAQEVACEKIRVNSVAPGAIATAINAEERARGSEEMLKLIPYGRIGEPGEIGRAVAWVVSDAADYMNGQSLIIDGGMCLFPGFRGNG